jgi:hypothetical protein
MGWFKQLSLHKCCYLGLFCIMGLNKCCYLGLFCYCECYLSYFFIIYFLLFGLFIFGYGELGLLDQVFTNYLRVFTIFI